jgi:hypothetical protein
MTYDLSWDELSKTRKINMQAVAVIALVIIGLASAVTTFAALSASQNVASSGVVAVSANIGVYSDSGCTIPLSSITWGNLTAGTNIQRTIYVKNTGSGCALTLSMTTSNWTPTTANGPITLTWNQETTRINPGQSVTAVITLAVSSSIVDITNFNVQISITGTN